ncbi:electron transport complex subunit RsxC [Amphritea opalescens]|uniref:Ion-translocating oxidoreductase complex subunit C n=1 Tax=Amphritea opalescens TaxID=2490544 RepID=A0A430KQ08_9GAMM|nr:electron transport complex subunit RsxC [Amphritea opalescens]RTE65545.1 electron transport complex subunit RsxC [Amphritea opalescens]
MKNTIRVHQFHGGIHPPENKKQSTGAPISLAPLPSRIILPLQQHIGLPADPIVKVGDRVLKGQRVAEAIGRISANIHASISGTVVDIGPHPVPHVSGMDADCLVIESDGQDEWIEHQGLPDYTQLAKPELIEYIRQAGVAGMGGAGFPTDVKLHLGDDHIVNTLIINAAECEPYITADDMLMRERADEILGGIEIIAHLLKPLHIMVGIEDNKPQAIRALHDALDKSHLNLDIVITPTKYPSGGEKQLIKLLTGVEVPSGKIPADVGIVCQNVGTTTAVYRAVILGEPLISRIMTVTGESANHKQNYEVRIGTPIADLLNHSGVDRAQMQRLIIGGPMMGITVTNEQIPVIKTTNCLIAASIHEMPPQPPAQACIRCGMCEQVCPAELLPQQLYWFAKGKEFDKARHHNLFDCIECGACSYVCPSNIPLVQYYRFAKAEIRKEDDEQRKADHARLRFEARLARLERDKIEKEERRKQRAIEAAAAQAAKKDAAFNKAASPATNNPTDAGVPDLKQLKSNAAIARTKLRKAEKALANAQDKGLDGIETLQATLKQLQLKSELAEKAYTEAQQAPAKSAAAPETDLKQLKSNAAIARTKLKKAEKQLAAAEAGGEGDIDALKAQVVALQAKSADAEKAYQAADSGTVSPVAIDTSALEAEIATLQGKVDKAENAWKAAVESGSPAAEKMAAGVEKLKEKLTGLQAELTQARSAVQPAATVDTSALDTEIATLQGKVDKAENAWKAAVESGSPAAEKMAAGVEKLKEKLTGLQAELTQARSAVQPAATVDTSALDAEITTLQGKVDKAENAWKAAVESGSPAADKMAAGVEKLKEKLKGLQAELTQAKGHLETNAEGKAEEAPAIDLKALKQQVSIMRTKLKKAEKQLAELPEGEDNASLMAEIEALRARHDAAKASFDAAEADKIAAAASEGIDLKQLKIDAALARAAVTKAERALSKAEQESKQSLETELLSIRAKADKLNATLERFSD